MGREGGLERTEKSPVGLKKQKGKDESLTKFKCVKERAGRSGLMEWTRW